jgi:hypothetical protein
VISTCTNTQKEHRDRIKKVELLVRNKRKGNQVRKNIYHLAQTLMVIKNTYKKKGIYASNNKGIAVRK